MDTDGAFPPLISSTPAFLTSLVRELASFESSTTRHGFVHHTGALLSRNQEHESGRNILSSLPASDLLRVKPLMLTLHCLFPNDLLLALDVLDRRLIRRFVVRERPELSGATEEEKGEVSARGHTQQINSTLLPGQNDEEIYFVRSTSPPSVRGGPPKSYEVRLGSWNCSCPAFTLSAFRGLETPVIETAASSARESSASYLTDYETSWFGGTLTRNDSRSSSTVCKHLLACVLATRCPSLFGDGIEETCTVTPMELAGWCAGWAG